MEGTHPEKVKGGQPIEKHCTIVKNHSKIEKKKIVEQERDYPNEVIKEKNVIEPKSNAEIPQPKQTETELLLLSQPKYEIVYMMPMQKPSEMAVQSASSSFWMNKLATPACTNSFSDFCSNGTQLKENAIPDIPVCPNLLENDLHNCKKDSPITDVKLEAKIKELPTDLTLYFPHENHHHIHCEYCGHCTIVHNGHIDYVHDAELHYLDGSGTFQ